MSAHINVLGYFIHAGMVVKSVMFILFLGSVASWTLIFERGLFFRKQKEAAAAFLNRFWRSTDLRRLYQDLAANTEEKQGLEAIFYAGYQAYWKRRQQPNLNVEHIDRVMQIEYAKQAIMLEERLSFFATLGGISPFIGLFGTVWGILTSFQALGQAQQATLAMVAPGFSEALVATALGLFTAIPAFIAYNRFTSTSNGQLEQYELFQQELIALIEDQSTEEGEAMFASREQQPSFQSQRALSSALETDED